jgi:hypothetical protein
MEIKTVKYKYQMGEGEATGEGGNEVVGLKANKGVMSKYQQIKKENIIFGRGRGI